MPRVKTKTYDGQTLEAVIEIARPIYEHVCDEYGCAKRPETSEFYRGARKNIYLLLKKIMALPVRKRRSKRKAKR